MQVEKTTSSMIPVAASSSTVKGINKDDFLKILISQIKYQDPLEPMKPDQFLSQLSQLTQVEQLQNMAKSLEELKTLADSGNISRWTSSIGKKMGVDDNLLSRGDTVSITPTGEYDSVLLSLKNQSDGSVKEVRLNKGDALTYKSDSDQTVLVGATAVRGSTPVPCKLTVFRTIAGIQTGDSGLMLTAADGKTYAVNSIKQIKE